MKLSRLELVGPRMDSTVPKPETKAKIKTRYELQSQSYNADILFCLTLSPRKAVGSSCRATAGYPTIHYKYADMHRFDFTSNLCKSLKSLWLPTRVKCFFNFVNT